MIKIYFTNETDLKTRGLLQDLNNICKVTQRKINRRGTFEVS